MIYAQWDGEKGFGQQNDGRGYLLSPVDNHKISIDVASEYGLFPVEVTEPSLSSNEVKDQAVWSFDGSVIGLTWTIRNKTQEELDEEIASPVLSREGFYILKNLFDAGVITINDIQNFSQAMRNAYAARARLEGF